MLACGSKPSDSVTATPHISLVRVEPDTRLEVIDWGGKGEAILFLAGLGNSAHIFDGFAPQFTDEYRVLGLTRRGFGASDHPLHGYHTDTLCADIRTVLDSLHLNKVTLVGHSIAGEELTRFAALYPERVDKLIYLDAAYDRTDLSFGAEAPAPPFPLEMSAADSSSPEKVQRFFERLNGVDFGLSEIQATSSFDAEGRYLGDGTPDPVFEAMMHIFERPAYEKVKAPALAFYCINDSVSQLFDYYTQLDPAQKKAAENVFRLDSLFTRRQMEVFSSQMRNGKAVEMHGAKHHLFLSNPVEVSRQMRVFLSGGK